MKWIHLTHEYYACVDDEDYERVSRYVWSRSRDYARCEQLGLSLHQFVIGKAPDGMDIDHVNRAQWDNRKLNLRYVERWENIMNRGIPLNPPSPTEQEMLEAKEYKKKLKVSIKSLTQKNRWNRGVYNKLKKKVIDSDGNVFESLLEATKSVGAKSKSSIHDCCLGRLRMAHGKTWRYL